MEDQKLEIIDPDAIVDIKMSTGFYNKLQEVLQFLSQGKSSEDMNLVYAQIKAQKIEDPYADVMQTMFILLKEFQVQANKAGHVREMSKEEAEAMLKEKFPEGAPELKVMDRDYREQKDETSSETSEEPGEEPAD
jgi:hypothetical protein